jgi:hypothetical protein
VTPSDGLIETWSLEDLQGWAAASGDPFGGRYYGEGWPPLALQLEASEDCSVWVGVDGRDLELWSRALEGALARWGLVPGDVLACFDYGSSPLTLLTIGTFAPYLTRGAAERLGADVICNDGIANMAARMADILRLVRPAAAVLRADVLAPLVDALDRAEVDVGSVCRWVAVSSPDGAPFPAETARYAARWSIPVHRVLRADAACFLAGSCPVCDAFHVDPELYSLEPLPSGGVAVTSFARTCPATRYDLGPATVLAPGCSEEPAAPRLVWP